MFILSGSSSPAVVSGHFFVENLLQGLSTRKAVLMRVNACGEAATHPEEVTSIHSLLHSRQPGSSCQTTAGLAGTYANARTLN